MNNINPVENARAVVADTNKTRSSQVNDAAKTGNSSGKTLPAGQAPESAHHGRKVARQQHAEQSVEKAVEQLNDYVQSLQRDLRFSIDKDLGRAIVHVVDRHTDEVIRQIPNETALRLARNLKERTVQASDLQGASVQSLESSLGLINLRI